MGNVDVTYVWVGVAGWTEFPGAERASGDITPPTVGLVKYGINYLHENLFLHLVLCLGMFFFSSDG